MRDRASRRARRGRSRHRARDYSTRPLLIRVSREARRSLGQTIRRRRVQALRPRRGRAPRAHLPGASRWARCSGSCSARRPSTWRCASGLTVSASVPIAVLSITHLPRVLAPPRRAASILENTVVQTTGSAGESIAAGVAFTLPALVLLGFEMDWTRTLLLSLCGGILGVLMMIPLRRYLIVKEHGVLTYPEGTAAAEVLVAGEERAARRPSSSSRGCSSGSAPSCSPRVFRLWPGVAELHLPALQGGAGVGGHLARADGRRLHHRLPVVGDHGGRRAAVLAGAHPGHRALRRGPRDGRCTRPPSPSTRCSRSTSGAATSATSARGRWRRAASSTS